MGVEFSTHNSQNTHRYTMSVLVMLEGQVKADKVDAFKAFSQGMVEKVKGQAACTWVKAAVEPGTKTVVIWQLWNDKAAASAYQAAVKAEGAMAKAFGDMLEPASFRRRELTPHN